MLPDKHECNVYNDVMRCAKFKLRQYFLHLVWDQTIKFKDRQYFWLYGTVDWEIFTLKMIHI